MNLNRYLWSLMSLIVALSLGVGCDDDDANVVPNPMPSVSLVDDEQATQTSLQFTIVPANAESCYYFVQEELMENFPTTPQQVVEQGVKLAEVKAQKIQLTDLKPGTSYKVTAAAINGEEQVMAEEALVMQTLEESGKPVSDLNVTITDVQVTTNSISYVVTCSNAALGAWDYYEATPDFVDDILPHDVFSKGRKFEGVQEPYRVVIEDLKDDTEYYIYAAAEAPIGSERKMAKELVRTKKLEAPDEGVKEVFRGGSLGVFHGRNYTIATENEKYSLLLDFDSSDEFFYLPFIPEHQYTYDKGAYKGDWLITKGTKIIEKASGLEVEIEKGSFDLKMPSASNYEIVGQLITKDNKTFEFTYTGELAFPIEASSIFRTILVKEVEGKVHMTMDLEFSLIELVLPSKFANKANYVLTDPGSYTAKELNRPYVISKGELNLASEDGNMFNVGLNCETTEGFKMVCAIENIRIDQNELPKPEEDEDILFERVTATAVDAYWVTTYQLEMVNKEWSFICELASEVAPGEVPVGKYIYSVMGEGSPSVGCLGQNYLITNNLDSMKSVNDLDEGYVEITKNGDGTYSVIVNIKRTGGRVFKGHFTGDISCFDDTGGGGEGWK